MRILSPIGDGARFGLCAPGERVFDLLPLRCWATGICSTAGVLGGTEPAVEIGAAGPVLTGGSCGWKAKQFVCEQSE